MVKLPLLKIVMQNPCFVQGYFLLVIYYIKLKSHLSICLSAFLWCHADNLEMAASIDMKLARNESCVF